ncbi:pilus assembly protein TadG-related protein [Aquamicrobium zhengzhouense]|uniref:DUF2134 domain-containing protein n=1 Tax=Aquamicrobium zhengzhouense TaxID=2781738 RepID=A0ABS0SFG1_9HYPH|nr:pilus assembly protein TadG-related protein [Aquamicrobium zhengzhouense]MBI1622039.1 hypothetical protein [Aquamicrobium zhengzhouense]
MYRLRPLLSKFLKARSGHFAIMTALTAPAAIVLAAIAVDSGSLYVEKRQAQALADLAAIAAALNPTLATANAQRTMSDNGVAALVVGRNSELSGPGARDRLLVTTGHYSARKEIDSAARFDPAGATKNAARVTYRTLGTRYFAGALIPPPEIVVTGVASATPVAAFSIGSRLARLDGGIINSLLSGLTGSQISLSLMDYEALLDTNVKLLSFIDALALDLDVGAGSYDEVLGANLTIGKIAKTMRSTGEIQGPALTALNSLVNQTTNGSVLPIKLSDLVDFGNGELTAASIRQVGVDMNALEFLMMSAAIAGRGKQVALDLGAQTGLLSAVVSLAIGEPPQHSGWLTVGEAGSLVRTAQTRLAITVEIGTPRDLLSLLGARIRLPLYLEAAYGEARLKSITCDGGFNNRKVEIEARPGIVNLYLAEVDRSKLGGFANPMARSPARLIDLPLVSITGQAQAEMSNTKFTSMTFTKADMKPPVARTVNTRDYLSSLTGSLFSSLSLSARLELGLLGIPLLTLPPNTLGKLTGAIQNVATPIDDLLYRLLSVLGVSLGEAEIKVYDANCGRAFLVQ